MTLFRWKKWLPRADRGVSRKAHRRPRKPQARFRSHLEGLEIRLAPAILTVDGVLDNTTPDNVLSLREAVLLVNNSGDASAALGRNLTAAEQARITGGFGSGDAVVFASALDSQTITLTSGKLSAVAGQDYTATSVLVSFDPGETTKTVSIPILNDTQVEARETLRRQRHHDKDRPCDWTRSSASRASDASGCPS